LLIINFEADHIYAFPLHGQIVTGEKASDNVTDNMLPVTLRMSMNRVDITNKTTDPSFAFFNQSRSATVNNNQNRIYVFMGVSGSGKSAVANAVAHQLSAGFLDGDFLHPRSNILKMAAGDALNDDDRAPWLAALNDAAFAMQRTNNVSVIICSALKKRYRDRLRAGNANLSFIYLQGEFPVIEERMAARKGHFFKSQMLISQFAALEQPGAEESDVITIGIHQPLDAVIAETLQHIRSFQQQEHCA